MNNFSEPFSKKILKKSYLLRLFPFFIIFIYVAIIAALPSAFILHKFLADRLNYFLMAKEIASHGSHTVSLALNTPPITYAYGASYLYALPIKLSNLFEYQLLGVQLLNLCLMGLFSALALRYAKSRLPGISLLPIALLIATSLLFNSNWQLSVLAPNADIMPALIIVACSLFFQGGSKPIEDNTGWRLRNKVIAAISIGVIGSFIKMTLITIPIALLVSSFMLAKNFKKLLAILVCAAGFGIAVIHITNQSIATEYMRALLPYLFPTKQFGFSELLSSIMSSLLNLVFSALPDQVIPNFRHIFVEAYYNNTFNPKTFSPSIALGVLVGLSISSIVIIGIISLWGTSRFEITMLLICTPVFIVVSNSTARYLMTFQPLIWAAFIKGILELRPYFKWVRVVYVIPFALVILLTQINSVSLRSRGDLNLTTRINEISNVYGGMLHFLRSQDASTTFGVQHFKVHQYSTMMWRAATNIQFYIPDSDLPNLVRDKHVLAIITCINPDCNNFNDALLDTFSAIEKTGNYRFNLIYSNSTSIARGEIYEITTK